MTRPGIELVSIDRATVEKAEQLIESCEHCHPHDAEIPFDWILAEVTGKRGPIEFMLTESAQCPNCKHVIMEKTLVEPKGFADEATKLSSVQAYSIPNETSGEVDRHLYGIAV